MSAHARCEFTALDAVTVYRLTTALIDQLSAQVDVDIDVLDALEFPLAEVVEALARWSAIEAVDVTLGDDTHLVVDFTCSGDLPAAPVLLGESRHVVTSFFDLSESDSGRLRLAGSLS